ncbi:MAG: hypothetical protein ACXAE3_08995 [Candidatus Kariarchaeaceae archaeon]
MKEASLITKAGVPLWVRSSGPSVVSGILTGAMLGALSMFSSEVTGQSLKSIEMSGGFRLHVRAFHAGEFNLAIIGDQGTMSDPKLLTIIQLLDEEIAMMIASSAVDLSDQNMIQIFLEKILNDIDEWFDEKVFVESALQKARSDQVLNISGQIATMSSKLVKEQIGVLILDTSLSKIYTEETKTITDGFFTSFQNHFQGWIQESVHQSPLIPSMMFFKDICVGINYKKNLYIICALEWKGSVGDPKTISQVRSWISLLSRRIV